MPANRDKKKSGFYIGIACPACGADLEIQENFFVLTCHHCGSAMRIVMPETPPAYIIQSKFGPVEARFHLDRYFKQNSSPLITSNLSLKRIYYPYWKISAIVLKLRNRIEERMVSSGNEYEQEASIQVKKTEISLSPFAATFGAGKPDDVIPYTLGMRTDYLKLIPFSEENIEENFSCMPVVKRWEEVENNLKKSIGGISSIIQADFSKNRTEYFHPQGVLIFFPYYLAEGELAGKSVRSIIDGITGRVFTDTRGESDDKSNPESAGIIEFGHLTVEHHRCPNCGVDLPAEQSFIYICSNCQKLISLESCPLMKSSIFGTDDSGRKSDRHFAFWAFRLSESQRKELQVLFGGIYQSEFLAVPAFRISNFEAMYRLSKRISSALPRISLQEMAGTDTRYGAVNIGPGEASALAEIIIYRERLSKTGQASSNPQKFGPQEIFLFYAPFHLENYFFVDSVLNAVTFEKSLA